MSRASLSFALALLFRAIHWSVLREYPKARIPFPEDINSDYLILLSTQHGLNGILSSFLEELYPTIPLATKLQALREDSALHNLSLEVCQDDLLTTLSSHNISTTVLKGVPLAKRLYRSLADRPVGDIDLEVTEQDWLKLKSVLR